MTNDQTNTDDRDDRLDHDDLTDAERAELDTNGDAAVVEQDEDVGAAAAAAAEDDGRAELRAATEAANKAAEAARLAAEAAARRDEPAAAADTPRDYAGEMAALKEQYDAGDLELTDYLEQRDAVKDAQREAQRAVERSEEEQRRAVQEFQGRWESAYAGFLSNNDNAVLLSEIIKPGFDAKCRSLFESNPNLGFDDLLKQARDETFKALNMPLPGQDTRTERENKVAKAVENRETKAGTPPASLRDAPSAGTDTAGGGLDTLDTLDTNSLEDRLATMSPEKYEAYLAGAPGGLRDYPRAVAE